MSWKLADAKNKLSEVLDRVSAEGPQTICRREESFVILPLEKYETLTGAKPSFKDWLLNGPHFDDLDLDSRDKSPMREVDL